MVFLNTFLETVATFADKLGSAIDHKPTCPGEEARKRVIHPDFETQARADVTRSPKEGYQWPHKRDSCPPKKFNQKNK